MYMSIHCKIKMILASKPAEFHKISLLNNISIMTSKCHSFFSQVTCYKYHQLYVIKELILSKGKDEL